MPRTRGSKNKPKVTKDYASQIAETQETIASLNTEIASITANIDTLKAEACIKHSADRKEKLTRGKSESLITPPHPLFCYCLKDYYLHGILCGAL